MGGLKEYFARRKPPREFLVGIALLLLVVLLWTVASFVVQDALDHGFPKPFWITYINSSSFIVYLIPYVVKHFLAKHGFRVWGSASTYQLLPTDGPDGSFAPIESTIPLTTKETARLAIEFAFPYFAMNWAIVASLKYTSVANATILGGTVGFFTLILGRMFRVEVMTTMKIVAVMTSFIGIALVSYSDTSSPTTPPDTTVERAPILGDIFALVGALVGAGYLVYFKHRVPDASRLDMQLLFGFFGLCNLLTVWPIGLVLHLTGWERFALPDTARTVVALVANAGVTVSGDLLYLVAMMKTTPLVVSVGQSLTMPLAVIGDFVLHGTASFLAIVGCVVVLVSFGVLGFESPPEKHGSAIDIPMDERHVDDEDVEMRLDRRLD